MKESMTQILQTDGVRAILKKLGVNHMLEIYFRSFPKNRKYGGLTYTVNTLEGWLLEKEIFQLEIYNGVFEMSTVKTFCDLGCNRGFFSLWVASKIGRNAQGLLVEANPHLVGEVSALLFENGLAGCKVFNGAVGAGPDGEMVDFLIPSTDVGAGLKTVASGVLKRDKCELQSVPALSAAQLWKETFGSETRCNLLKIDIEGAEWSFMRDEKNFLKLVDKVVVEIHTKMGNEQELLRLIEELGFHETARHTAGDGVYLLFAERNN